MSIIVVFYSRYSPSSLGFLEEIEKFMEVRKLCVDNEEIRTAILQENENYNIELVPSLLIFHSNGFLEKQSGETQCFEWLEKVKPPMIVEEKVEKQMEEIVPISKIPKRISVDDLNYDEELVDNSPRKMDTGPLIMKEKKEEKMNNVDEKIKEDRETYEQNNVKKTNQPENVMSLAQQMQKQREMEVKE